MSVIIRIPPYFRHMTHDQERAEVQGNTIGDCLEKIIERFPALEKVLFESKGRLQNSILIYVNGKSSYPDELGKPIQDGDELLITVLMAGG